MVRRRYSALAALVLVAAIAAVYLLVRRTSASGQAGASAL